MRKIVEKQGGLVKLKTFLYCIDNQYDRGQHNTPIFATWFLVKCDIRVIIIKSKGLLSYFSFNCKQ